MGPCASVGGGCFTGCISSRGGYGGLRRLAPVWTNPGEREMERRMVKAVVGTGRCALDQKGGGASTTRRSPAKDGCRAGRPWIRRQRGQGGP